MFKTSMFTSLISIILHVIAVTNATKHQDKRWVTWTTDTTVMALPITKAIALPIVNKVGNSKGSSNSSNCVNMEKIMPERNAVVKVPPGCTDSYISGSICFFKCKAGMSMFQRLEYVISTCTEFGEFLPPIPVCHEVNTCDPPTLSTGLKLCGECSMVEAEPCPVNCDDGFTLKGPPFIVCHGKFGWSVMPKCVENSEEKKVLKEVSKSNQEAPPQPPPPNPKCPRGSQQIRNFCYSVRRKSNGYKAYKECKYPMHPLVIRTKEVYEDLIELMKTNKAPCIWTGINDIRKEGIWRDALNGDKPYLVWDTGEPSGQASKRAKAQDCVVMASFYDFKYHDFHCGFSSCNVICQAEARP